MNFSFWYTACASDCLTPANFKFNDTALQCADPSDPECVCQMIYGNGGAYLRDPRTGYYTGIGNDTLKYTDFNYQKCMLDTCDEQEAAVAIIQMGVDCGEFVSQTDSWNIAHELTHDHSRRQLPRPSFLSHRINSNLFLIQ